MPTTEQRSALTWNLWLTVATGSRLLICLCHGTAICIDYRMDKLPYLLQQEREMSES